jgi:hypothetical protein
MKILAHFDRSNKANYILYRLKKGEWTNFIGKLPDEFRKCYITDKALDELSTERGITKSEFLEKYVLPDEPTIKSGDFGELLCFHAVIENFEGKGLLLFAPKKWQWKDNRNKAAPGADAILFHIANLKKPSKKDILITIESKMKAVNSKEHRIQDAIDGATTDKLTRMAKTLSWLEEKYARYGAEARRQLVERFKDPATYGDYQKQYKAVAIMDSDFEADETSKAISNIQGVTVIVFSIKELKKAYEDTRTNTIKSV